MKKIIASILPLLLLLPLCFSLQSCSAEKTYSEGEGEINILCSSFAPFDFARNVGGDRVTVSLLQDSGADLHNYTPTVATLDAISKADIFIYIGGTSDSWVHDTVEAAGNGDLVTLCLMDFIDPIHAELENDWTSHSHEEAEEHGDHEENGHEGHDHGADEHIWTSVRNAISVTEAIKDLLCDFDKDGRETYESNTAAYVSELQRLDGEISEIAHANEGKPLLFADRFPFVYLMHDYHIPYMAAFSGCSTEVNSGFETQIDLIKKVGEHSLDCIIVIEGGDKSLAEAISRETGCRILYMDSLQSVSRSDIKNGKTYISAMEKNISVLREAYHVTD